MGKLAAGLRVSSVGQSPVGTGLLPRLAGFAGISSAAGLLEPDTSVTGFPFLPSAGVLRVEDVDPAAQTGLSCFPMPFQNVSAPPH